MGKRKVVGDVDGRLAPSASVEDDNLPENEFSGFSEESEGELDTEQNEQTNGQQPPKKKTKKQLSAEDIQIARETAELFKSNIFKLQIEELLKEVKLKDGHISLLEKVLHRLHDLISQVAPIENQTLAQAEGHFNHKKTVIPFPDPKPSSVNYTFSYLPPQDISLVGSFGLKAAINQRQPSAIDVALTMPQEIFQPKDYLNYRALYKRAFYIAYLAEHLIPLSKKNHLPIKVMYEFLNDDVLCPVLRLESIKTDIAEDLDFHDTGFHINILVGFPFGVFDAKKLLHDKNCIRVQSDDELPATPIYNSSVLSMTAYEHYLKFLYTNKKAAESFKDACVLGRLWLSQRGMRSSVGNGGFGHFEFAILMAALLAGGGTNGNKILLQGFSSYQLFKGTINYLACMDLSKGYLSFSSATDNSATSKYLTDSDFNTPVIFDRHARLNILWKMSQASYERLQYQARQTLTLLNDVVKDRFDPILLQKSDLDDLQFDIMLRISIPDELEDSFGPLEKIKYLSFDSYIKEKVSSILKRALGARAALIYPKMTTKYSRPFQIHKRKPNNKDLELEIGIKIDPEESERLVTRGPAEDSPENESFRAFWGSKSSLRRFKDGTIQYCVVWSIGNEPLVTSIAKYALDLHLHNGISQHIECIASDFNCLLPTPLLPAANNNNPTNLSGFITLKSSFDRLTKTISELDLPLGIKAISPSSPALRFSSLLQPVPFALSNPDFWNDVVLQFETSTRWPDEISALEKTKSAFLLKILKELESTEYRAHIVQDETIPFNENVTTLNVLTPEGYGFRVRVLTERDEVLYLRAVENSDKRKPIAHEVYLKFNRCYLGSVKHTRSISTLAHHYPFYSATVRLFKLWLDSQLILQHISEELVELIVLKVFTDLAPYSPPNSVIAGFLQVLSFLSTWNWRDDPLILDMAKKQEDEAESYLKDSDKLTNQSHQVILLNFEKIRKSDPSGIKTQFFVASKDDPSGILWSNGLTLPIASRITALSRLALKVFLDKGFTKANLDLVFVPGLSDFDFVLNLKSTDLSKDMGVLKGKVFKNLVGVETSFPQDITNKVDLVQIFVDELNKKFGNVAIFFARKCNMQDKSVVGGLFLPNILTVKKFKVTVGINVKPVNKDEIALNKSAVFDEITQLAGDTLVLINRKGT